MMSHWLDVLNNAQFHFRTQAAEAEAAALHGAAPTMIGIGVVLKAISLSGLFTVENVVEGGPADKSQKFQIGDYLVEVDGHDTYQSEFDTVLGWIRGELGTFVSIVVARVTDEGLMQRTATSEDPYGDAAEILSIGLRRDIVNKIDIYAQFPTASGPATAPKQAPTCSSSTAIWCRSPPPSAPPTCSITTAAASATAGLLPKTCRQNEKKSADEGAAMVEGFESRVTRPQHSAARASRAQSLQCCGGISIPLRGGEAEPSDGLRSVLRNTSADLKHVAQVELSDCMPLRR
jgi:hypothetical protein